ncbi:ribosome biogenesis GTP-binding protein YsxC [Plasmodium fragile]|uniref:Ribosome biogenesis GTP-binding protein YsxC n=1 Tax=Plasmodium fragile TaxID=5857 RepID=A0A0D9QIC8_PLAFR|nr:ribosome biogenesis GTP-binding protein YsxC [Plasmodium fragile]KJP85476.1 ribosome biogenesis GTP-binding protein YsxC [Plasmodium fragile]
MRGTYLWIFYYRTKHLRIQDSFPFLKLRAEQFADNFVRNYGDTINGVKNELKIMCSLCNMSMRMVHVSLCESANCGGYRTADGCEPTFEHSHEHRLSYSGNNAPAESAQLEQNTQPAKNGRSKLATYLIIHYVKEYVKFVVHSLLHFYFYLCDTFYRTLCVLPKGYLEFPEQLDYYSSISDNLLTSFVTIYKIYKKSNSSEFRFKLDELAFLGSGFIYDKRESDICVMKINSEEYFSHIPLNPSREFLKPGETVITYGQIQNFDKGTCSIGVVNQPRQTFTKFENFCEKEKTCLYPFIQISNPINKGMSGSPLIDKHGNLVGMIQKKIDNYGLALPVNILKNITTHLQQEGTYKEPFLGIVLREKEQSTSAVYKKCKNEELKIQDVLVNSPADVAAITKGDIILTINNKGIKNICDVHEILNSTSDGYITVDIIRHGKNKKIKVKKKIYNIKKKEDLEYKPFKNISFNKLKTNLKNFLVINKKFNISDVKHVSFLGKFHNYEKIENYGVNEICILGRSNVGKSTFLRNFIKYLINVNEHANVKVSKNSGCTRSINLYSFENGKKKKLFILTDMPGFGYAAGIGKKKMEFLRKNLEDYIFLRNQICLFFVLIDMSVDIQKIDVSIVDAIKQTNIPFRVICTKSDKFSANAEERLQAIKNFYELEKIPIHISKFSTHN